MENLTGQRFSRLMVISLAEKRVGRNSFWNCICDCGVKRIVRGTYLKTGHTMSCGCHARDKTITRCRTHGEAARGNRSSEYRSWGAMIRRCFVQKDQKYPDYGGRGITVCERWRTSFGNFVADMGRKPSRTHTIDRIDNDGNYEPSNCRWATPKQQANNQRPKRKATVTKISPKLAKKKVASPKKKAA